MEWIKCTDRLPEVEQVFPKKALYVLIYMDFKKWGRDEQRIEKASVHFADEPRGYGGPSALTGAGTLRGVYFAIPAIVNPESVTYWMPLPPPPTEPEPTNNNELASYYAAIPQQ